jgi:hypothetical protein
MDVVHLPAVVVVAVADLIAAVAVVTCHVRQDCLVHCVCLARCFVEQVAHVEAADEVVVLRVHVVCIDSVAGVSRVVLQDADNDHL